MDSVGKLSFFKLGKEGKPIRQSGENSRFPNYLNVGKFGVSNWVWKINHLNVGKFKVSSQDEKDISSNCGKTQGFLVRLGRKNYPSGGNFKF